MNKFLGFTRMCLFGLAIAASALSASASARTINGAGRAVILRPLSVVKVEDLNFGSFTAGAASGTVSLNPLTGARTTSGGVTAMPGTFQAAQLLTLGQAGRIVQITRGALPTLTRAGGGGTMPVTALTLNGATLRVLTVSGLIDLRVGGTLQVNANQAPGNYAGSFTMNVNYF